MIRMKNYRKRFRIKELQKYIGYEMIRCDGHGMKKERRKCNSCVNFTPIEGVQRKLCC